MGTSRPPLPLLASLLVLFAGCATIRAKPGFEDVEKLASTRTSARLSWNAGTPEDEAADGTVRDILARELTAESAVQVALLQNRKLQATYASLGIAQADLVQAGMLKNPVLTADVRFGLGMSGTGADIGVVQEFLSILQIPLRKRVAAAAFEATKFEVAAAVLELATRVKETFYALQGAEQMLDLRRTVVQADAVAADLAARQHAAGNITDLDFANEQALYEQARVDLAEAEVSVLTRREDLTALLGLWGRETEWKLGARLPELPGEDVKPEGLETLAVSQRLDLAAAAQQRVVVAENLGLTRFYGLIPEASTGVESQREVEGGVWSLGPSLSLPIPVFDQRQATLANYQSQLAQAQERYGALAVDIRSEVRRARLRMAAARTRASYYKRVVLPLRSKIVEQTQREYNGMLIGVFQLLQAKRDEVDAGRRYIEALTEYWVSRAELERAVGGELRVAESAPAPSEVPAAPSGGMPEHHHHGG